MALRKLTDQEILEHCWLSGNLDYKLHPGQWVIEKRVAQSTQQLFVGEIARQFGKSFWLVKKSLEKAFTQPRGRIKYATAFQSDLLEFILPTFEVITEDCPESLKPVWKAHKSKFIIPHNDAEIKLIGLDLKPNGLRGSVIDLIVLDEAGFMSRLDYIYKSVIIPATTHRPDCRILVFSTPPSTPAHEFLDYVQKAELEGGYLKLTIYDNPRVDEKTINRLRVESGGEESTTWRREYLCEHVTDANLAIISDWKDEYVQDLARDAYYSHYHKYVFMDLGVSDNTAVLYGYYDFLKAKLVIEDEFTMSGSLMNTKILQAKMKVYELSNWSNLKSMATLDHKTSNAEISSIDRVYSEFAPNVYLRVSDNNNPLLLQDLSYLHGMHFVPTDKGRLNEMVNTLKILVRNGGLVVHPRCKQTIGCLKYGVWDKNREKFAHSNVYGHFDALAALIYGVRNLNRFTNPIPQDFQLDQDNQILFKKNRESDTAATLKNAFKL